MWNEEDGEKGIAFGGFFTEVEELVRHGRNKERVPS
jgi:hypothetical protein